MWLSAAVWRLQRSTKLGWSYLWRMEGLFPLGRARRKNWPNAPLVIGWVLGPHPSLPRGCECTKDSLLLQASQSHAVDFIRDANESALTPWWSPDIVLLFLHAINKGIFHQTVLNTFYCLKFVFLVLSYTFSTTKHFNAYYRVVRSSKAKIFDRWSRNLIFVGIPAA